jgi:hypothetical protein
LRANVPVGSVGDRGELDQAIVRETYGSRDVLELRDIAEHSKRLLAPFRLGNNARRNAAPRRPVLRRMCPPIVAGGVFSSERNSLWAALLLIWAALWLLLVSAGRL